MANRFLSQLETSTQQAQPEKPGQASSNRFLSQIEGIDLTPKEGILKSTGRTIYQVPAGLAKRFTWPLDLITLAGAGEAINDFDEIKERLPELKKMFPHADWSKFENLSREDYLKSVQEAMETFPTQENIERDIEKKTGLPLTAKTKGQKLVRFASTAGGFKKGGIAAKAQAGAVAAGVKTGLEALDVPEPVAEFSALGISGATPTLSASKSVKPSGMVARRFEDIKKPTTVSAGRQQVIKESVENDFKKIADQILEKKSKTYSTMKEDTLFKQKIGDLFQKVENLAEEIPGTISTEELRGAFRKRISSRETKGITPDEYERAFRKEVRKILKEIPYDEITAKQQVEQFRKNNKSLPELFEPGKSSASNRAKRDALLEYNRAIEDVIGKKYPETEFKDLFEFTNKRWQEINDLEQIDTFLKDIFEGKINYSKAKQIFSRDKNIQRPFKRVLGEEGFEDFKKLTEDLLSTEKSMKYIKKAKDAGFEELSKTASLYLINKKVGAARTLSKAAKLLYQTLLDKPKLLFTWQEAMTNLKNGNYNEAQKYFTILHTEIKNDQSSSPK